MILLYWFMLFISLLLMFILWRLNYWQMRKILTLPISFPFGNAKDILIGRKSFGVAIQEAYNFAKSKQQKCIGFYFTLQPILIPVDLKLLRKILINDFQYFTDHNPITNEKNDPLSGHLFNLTGAKWKALRSKLSPVFTVGKLKYVFHSITDCTKNFHYVLDDAIEQEIALDIKDVFGRYTGDVIGSIGFGIDCNCLKIPNSEFITYGKKVFNVDFKQYIIQILSMIYPQLMNILKLKFTSDDVESFFLNVVENTVKYRDEKGVERKDFMQLLMKLRDQEIIAEKTIEKDKSKKEVAFYQNGLTLEEVAAQAFSFFVAGYETSSTTLQFLMYEIAKDPELQEKIRKESRSVLQSHGGNITYEAIQEMTFLEKCLMETLRKYPPFLLLPRRCTKDYRLEESNNVIIKAGTTVMIPVYAIHHDPEYYPNPEIFDPNRFSEENKLKRPPSTFLAFGDGPRLCIGLKLGILQTKVGLVSLLQDYKFALNSRTKTPLEIDPKQFVFTAKGGVWVNAYKIK